MNDKKRVYLDWAAGWSARSEVIDQFAKSASSFGNASSYHQVGLERQKEIEDAREKIAAYLQTRPKNIIFTSGGTESNNLALQGIYKKATEYDPNKKAIITTPIEHPSIIETAESLAGKNLLFAKVDKNGLLDLNFFEKLLSQNQTSAALVSVQYVNNEIGTLQNIDRIAALCKKQKIAFHTDAVQAHNFKTPIDFSKFDNAFISISAHKIGGVSGAGALAVPDFSIIAPTIFGGGHEKGLRSGSLNCAAISAFGSAAEIIERDKEFEERSLAFAKKIVGAIQTDKELPHIQLNGLPVGDKNRVNYILNLQIDSSKSVDELAYIFDSNSVAISFGSACSAKVLGPSSVLLAIGKSDARAKHGLRVSFGYKTDISDIDAFLKLLKLV
ncbi:MAG: cysteine desulfurase [Bifidobacteriaceae bacterium]|jgi:cysteine desulfurase|nr:cysteine desulfurase [Bifidobacteriaceae bacterium]